MQNQSLFNSSKGGTRLLPILHGGIGIKTGGVFFFVVGSFTADSNLLQPTGSVSHVTFFSFTAHGVSQDIGSSVLCASSHPCVRVIVCSLFDLHLALFIVSPYLPLLLPEP